MTARWIEYQRLDRLKPAERNPKRHLGAAIEASIDRFGFADPFVVDERTGRLVSGHGRREALLARYASGKGAPAGVVVRPVKDGCGWMVPVMKGWASRDDAEAEAVLLSVNRLVETGGWDRAALAAAVRQAQEAVDLTTLGFGQAEVERLLAGERAAVDRARARNPDSGSEASGAYAFRQIVLGYGGEEYAEVLAGLDAVRGELGVESNTEAALAVLREAAGEAT